MQMYLLAEWCGSESSASESVLVVLLFLLSAASEAMSVSCDGEVSLKMAGAVVMVAVEDMLGWMYIVCCAVRARVRLVYSTCLAVAYRGDYKRHTN